MKWHIHSTAPKLSEPNSPSKHALSIVEQIIKQRGLDSKAKIEAFLNPPHPLDIQISDVDIDRNSITKTKKIIQKAIDSNQPIIVYGDYDADGITATGILWETLHSIGAKATPFIPSREEHGYGISSKGLKDAIKQIKSDEKPLIITVDNGIVANEAAKWAKEQQISLIITDHHTKGKTLPVAQAIVHTTKISGAGVAWMLAKELNPTHASQTLDLLAIGTIADMMPLMDANRSFAKFGLKALSQSKRPGIRALLNAADINTDQELSTYHVNYGIAPRLNAMGRLEHAIDSLRLICTTNPDRAAQLAELLHLTNQTRQDLTTDMLTHALEQIDPDKLDPILVVSSLDYHEGVIGLIAGKLTETFSRPAIVISQKEGVSKGSARSIKGVNITELIRTQSELLVGVGGHPMAAGFSIESHQIETFKQLILSVAATSIDSSLFEPTLDVDVEITFDAITNELYQQISGLAPFGIANKQPILAITHVSPDRIQTMGKDNQHLKLVFHTKNNGPLEALWFNHGQELEELQNEETVDLAFTLNQNNWRGKTKLQLMVKDIKTKSAI